MPSLTVIINGTSDPLKKELQAVERLAKQSGSSISRGLNSGSEHLKSGVIGEALVLMREVGRQNYSRIPGSLTILAQRMGLLTLILKDNATVANVLADAWQLQAEKAGLAAMAATRKAQASLQALYADGGETEATLNAAIADEEKAAADIAVMKTTQAKAAASTEAAAASNLEAAGAKTAVGPLGMLLGILTGIAVGAYAASHLVRQLTDALSGVKAPAGFEPDYIVKRMQKGNSAAEGQRQINQEIAKSVQLYHSAAEAAKRTEETTKSHFDHLRKMNEFREQAEMNRATSEGQRAAIRKKYSDQELAINRDQRAKEIQNKQAEQGNLEHEAREKKSRADAIDVAPAKHDENQLNLAKAKLKAIKDADDVIQKGKNDPGFLNLVNSRDAFRAYNAVAATGVSTSDLDNAERQVSQDKVAQEQEVKRLEEQKDANDLLRKNKSELIDQAGKASATAAGIKQALPAMVSAAAKASSDEAQEATAKLAAERKYNRRGVDTGPSLSAFERAGGAIGGISLVDINRDQLKEIRGLRQDVKALNNGPFRRRGFG